MSAKASSKKKASNAALRSPAWSSLLDAVPKEYVPSALGPALAAPYDVANDLYNLITNNKPATDSVNTLYDELMQKEQRVLDTIKRVVEDKADERRQVKAFLSTPVEKIPLELVRTMTAMFAEFAVNSPKDYAEFMAIMIKDHRMIYAGISLIIVALFLMFIQISDKPTAEA